VNFANFDKFNISRRQLRFSPSRQAMASSSTRTASSTGDHGSRLEFRPVCDISGGWPGPG
jgi:hypothetical protein